MEWISAKAGEDGSYIIPERWLHLYYYEALNILFRFENALRIFVYVILKRELGKDWDLAALGDGITVRTETRKRLAQAKEHGYLGYDISSPMLFLNSGELTQLIVSDTYWKLFAPYFKATKSIVLTKLQEIGTVRNSLAHFRPIKQDDIDLIKQNSKHLLIAIEDCLVQITSISNVVPTNTEEAWYKEIVTVGNEHFQVALFSNRDQEWIRVCLTYKSPKLSGSAYQTYANFKVGNFRTDQLVELYPAIRDNCVYISEGGVSARMLEGGVVAATKAISVVFPKATLESNLASIVDVMKEMALLSQTETELINQDSLARGKLIDTKSIWANLREAGTNYPAYWSFNTESMSTPVSEVDYVEYWGKRGHYATDFISSTSHYPWMPSSVSKDELPF